VLVETAGLAVLFSVYAVLHANDSVLAPLLVPPVVSFVLVVAQPQAVGSRPGRVVGSYLIAGVVGLSLSASPGPDLLEAVAAGSLALLLMHLTGALHSPAIAVSLIAVMTEFSPMAAGSALPLLMGLSMLVVLLAWGAHRTLGDADYPARWW
jgi:CBS-domain-containing membrane protein